MIDPHVVTWVSDEQQQRHELYVEPGGTFLLAYNPAVIPTAVIRAILEQLGLEAPRLVRPS